MHLRNNSFLHLTRFQKIQGDISEMCLRIHPNNIRRCISRLYFDHNRMDLRIAHFDVMWVRMHEPQFRIFKGVICTYKGGKSITSTKCHLQLFSRLVLYHMIKKLSLIVIFLILKFTRINLNLICQRSIFRRSRLDLNFK